MIEKLTYVLITYALLWCLRNFINHSLVTSLFPFDDAKLRPFSYPKQIKQEKLIKKCYFVDASQGLCTHTQRNSLNLCAHTILDTKQKKVLKSPIIGQKRGHYIIIYGVSDIRLLVKCNNILVKTERNIEKKHPSEPYFRSRQKDPFVEYGNTYLCYAGKACPAIHVCLTRSFICDLSSLLQVAYSVFELRLAQPFDCDLPSLTCVACSISKMRLAKKPFRAYPHAYSHSH